MSRTPGAILDKEDRSKVDPLVGRSIGDITVDEVRRSVLSESVRRRIQPAGTTLVTGADAAVPDRCVPLLYFYKNIAVDICPRCPQLNRPDLLEPLLDRGIAFVTMNEPFEETPKRFQELAAHYPELVIGPDSNHAVIMASQGMVPEYREHLCKKCRTATLKDLRRRVADLRAGPLQFECEQTLAAAGSLAGEELHSVLQGLKAILDAPDYDEAKDLASYARLAVYVATSRGYDAELQMDAAFFDNSGLLTHGLQIDQPKGVTFPDYLDLIEPHRGKLSREILPLNEEAAMVQVQRINDEVDKIRTSKRLSGGRSFFTWVVPALPILSRVLEAGRFAHDGSSGPRYRFGRVPVANSVPVPLLAAFFGVSGESVRVWMLRRELSGRA